MSCVCARIASYGWRCEITGDACMFLIPCQDACADEYGEVEHTEKWEREHEEEGEEHDDKLQESQ